MRTLDVGGYTEEDRRKVSLEEFAEKLLVLSGLCSKWESDQGPRTKTVK